MFCLTDSAEPKIPGAVVTRTESGDIPVRAAQEPDVEDSEDPATRTVSGNVRGMMGNATTFPDSADAR